MKRACCLSVQDHRENSASHIVPKTGSSGNILKMTTFKGQQREIFLSKVI
jgi:hypothetical protein